MTAATIFLEGFDKYGITGESNPSAATLLAQNWNSLSGSYSIVAGLSSPGFAMQSTATTSQNISKTLPTTYTRLAGGVRFSVSTLASTNIALIGLYNGATQAWRLQVTLSSGTITLFNGANTLLASSTQAVTANSTHHLSFDITIGASSSYTVYLDGVQVFTGTGNTGNGQASVNAVVLSPMGNGTTCSFDDLFIMDPTGTGYNSAVLTTTPRIETRLPSSDSQTQFTNSGNTITPVGIVQTGVSVATATVNTPLGNQLVLIKITPSATCNLQSIGIIPQTTSAGANYKGVLYTDSAGTPNTLVSTGTQVTGAVTGTVMTLPFGAGQTLTGGTSYWFGFICDTSINLSQYDASTNKAQKAANTYASGAPGTAPAMTAGQPSYLIWGNATGATVNFESVASNPPDGPGPAGDNGSILSSTVNNEDLYGFPALSASVTTVYAIGITSHLKKSDAGARTADLRLKSAGTDSAGSQTGFSPATTYAWVGTYYDQDPATSTAWLLAAANSATAGPKVAS